MDIITLLWINFAILAGGTAFAWYQWYLVLRKKCTTCSIAVHENPFLSKCFYGALFFTAAFAVNAILIYLA